MAEKTEVTLNLTAAAPGSDKPEEARDVPDATVPATEGLQGGYLTGWRLSALLLCLGVSTFLTGLNESLVATAIPKITVHFHSVDDIGWYSTAYFLSSSCTILLFGRLYNQYPAKPILAGSIALFEIGCLVSGTATSSAAFIIGRLLSGFGCAGMNTGCLTVLAHAVPLERRPIFSAIIDGGYSVASSCGPLLGGAITTRLSWRWCFLINTPPGALCILAILIVYQDRYLPAGASEQLVDQIARLDLGATLLFASSVTCLVLPLQWGGSTFPWSSPKVIALFVLFGIFLATLIGHQLWRGEAAMVPRRVGRQREMVGAAVYAFFVGGTANILEYYIPLWFQEVWTVSALRSGIYTIPMVAGFVVFSLVAGFGVSSTGYYLPFMYLGSCALIAGSALLTTIHPASQLASLLGFEILIGVGGGSGIQQAYLVAQAILTTQDVAIGLAVIVMAQTLGGTVLLSIATSVVQEGLVTATSRGDSPSISGAIIPAFYLAIATSVGSLASLALLRMRSIKGDASAAK
ncbi:hypothetical protein ASPNIDRAFT_214740 [Aspergillus niger ATCC 1015]|uniref:Major facilitator superfamily (MFS) profile domain-containing protein n=2 Tax=Aspergillus niger TaxID=5061 RepID=G3Y7Y8_ASPNA|nr:hypothetical protein ASPNIDRAFT_214740 [Aspergillus niger ATCC 1015]KAI2985488.1 hypothetical protein CBS147345_11031 [Aspergillus niger]TPR10603.1 Fungal specific transcription factor domain family protein [Aspergillus niger]GKZ91467.1 hypothetical protein AnigIFM59636_003724 [Aspergillus niger]SPB50626.1 unnamed protein product [Aspergillus niger]